MMRRSWVVVVAVALLVAACGADPERTAVAPGTTTPASSTSVVVSSSEPSSTTSTPNDGTSTTTTTEAVELAAGIQCDPDLDTFVDAQFAFVGTVVDVRGEILPWDVDLEKPDRPTDPEPTRWVTFDVDGWYTTDWGTEFSVWMPTHVAALADRLAVGGDARFVSIDGFSGQSGEVEFCTPADEADRGSLTAWDAFFGAPIDAGAAMPEGDADPNDLAAIDDAEAAFAAVVGESYSYVFSTYNRGDQRLCGTPSVRVVVTPSGTVATNLDAPRPSCDIEIDEVPTIDELFALARQVAGATKFDFRSNLDQGIVMNFFASDRSVEVQVNVRRLSESTAPTVVGWNDVVAATSEAAERWAAVSGDRTTSIRIGGGERAHYDLTTTEIDGRVTEVRNGTEPIDPGTLQQPWNPYTVDGVFDLIDELSDQGHVAAVFDPDTGVPTDLYFDPVPDGVDDELTLYVSVTDATNDVQARAVSPGEQALRDAGANLIDFPGDLSDPRLAEICGSADVAFDAEPSSLDPIIECLSQRAGNGTGAAAVFTVYTDEGDPIVVLWLVDSDRASVFTDSTRDAFAGGPFPWHQFDCDVELPLAAPTSQYPDARSIFTCR